MTETGFVRAPGFAFAGPADAKGALVWVHGTYGRDQTGPPDPPDYVAREASGGMDIWCLNRDRGNDPLAGGAAALAAGVATLRRDGYRRIIAAGHSRGAWIALSILAHPGLADGVAAFSPAAHGTRPERKDEAMRAWEALWAAADTGTKVVLAQLDGDPWDPGPSRRLMIANRRMGPNLLPVFLPETPTGHAGVYEPAFDRLFGAAIADFLR